VWSFERAGEKSLRAVRSDNRTRWHSYPEFILDISRPSAGRATALVHAGGNPGPLIGRGETRVWTRRQDGSWEETREVVSQWIS